MNTLAKIYAVALIEQHVQEGLPFSVDFESLDYLTEDEVSKLNNTYKLKGIDKDNMPEDLIGETLNQLKSEIHTDLTEKESNESMEEMYRGFYEFGSSSLASDESHLWKQGGTKEWN